MTRKENITHYYPNQLNKRYSIVYGKRMLHEHENRKHDQYKNHSFVDYVQIGNIFSHQSLTSGLVSSPLGRPSEFLWVVFQPYDEKKTKN